MNWNIDVTPPGQVTQVPTVNVPDPACCSVAGHLCPKCRKKMKQNARRLTTNAAGAGEGLPDPGPTVNLREDGDHRDYGAFGRRPVRVLNVSGRDAEGEGLDVPVLNFGEQALAGNERAGGEQDDEYWVPSTTKPPGVGLGVSKRDLDRENRRRMGLRDDDHANDDYLPLTGEDDDDD